MQTGWVTLNGNYYYLDPSSGKMAANTTLTINGVSYSFNANGVYQSGGSSVPGGNTSSGASAPGNSYSGPGGSTGSTYTPSYNSPTSSGNPSSNSNSNYKTLKPGLTGGPGTYR